MIGWMYEEKCCERLNLALPFNDGRKPLDPMKGEKRTRPMDTDYAVEVEGLSVLCMDVTLVGVVYVGRRCLVGYILFGVRKRTELENEFGGKKMTAAVLFGCMKED